MSKLSKAPIKGQKSLFSFFVKEEAPKKETSANVFPKHIAEVRMLKITSSFYSENFLKDNLPNHSPNRGKSLKGVV